MAADTLPTPPHSSRFRLARRAGGLWCEPISPPATAPKAVLRPGPGGACLRAVARGEERNEPPGPVSEAAAPPARALGGAAGVVSRLGGGRPAPGPGGLQHRFGRRHGGAAESLRTAAAALRDQGEGAAAGGAAQRGVRAVLPRPGGRAAQGRAPHPLGPRLRRGPRPCGGVQRQGAAGPGAAAGAGGPPAGRGPAPLLPQPPVPGSLPAPGSPRGRAALPGGAEGRPGGGAGDQGVGRASCQGEGWAGGGWH